MSIEPSLGSDGICKVIPKADVPEATAPAPNRPSPLLFTTLLACSSERRVAPRSGAGYWPPEADTPT